MTVLMPAFCINCLVAAQTPDAPVGQNLARGAAYTLSPPPSYPHCTDPGDATQLTDGQLTEGYFWTQPGTVGWRGAKYAAVTIDLGKVETVSGVSFRTAAGVADVCWPAAIRIQVSEDGKAFYDLGDLLELDDTARDLPVGYAIRRFSTSKLRAHGRYVRLLAIPTGTYLFTDEIEVFRGDASFLQISPATQPVSDGEEAYLRYRIEPRCRSRFDADAGSLAKCIQNSPLPAMIQDDLRRRLDEVHNRLTKKVSPASLRDFRAILPFNDAHADLFRIQAALWKALGRPPLSAWAVCPWDPQDLMCRTDQPAKGPVTVHTMLGEYRAVAFNLANATDEPMRVSFHLTGIPGATAPGYVTAYRVPWTDTTVGQPVTAALVEMAPQDGQWIVDVLPGLTQQIWLSFHVESAPAGKHSGAVVVQGQGDLSGIALPLDLHVYPLMFPARTTLWVGGWSYTDGQGSRGVTPANHQQFVQHLRSRFVNAPWATSQVMMGFRLQGDTPVLDTARFDEWLTQWPDARTYMVFLNVDHDFAGAQMGTPAFERRVASWISAWVDHLGRSGVSPDRLALLLVDEPHQNAQDDVIIAWAKVIHAAQPRVLVWQDPVYKNPRDGKAEMYELSNILCPNRPMWLAEGKPFEEFYVAQQKRGRTLQFYSCNGPARLLDPYAYYRLQAWHCWQVRATGSFFWAFGDNSGYSSWNEYPVSLGPYTPLFLDDTGVTPAKQMEAIRESVEDYEYFVMLENLVRKFPPSREGSAVLARARDLLAHGADQVLAAEGARDLMWRAPKNRALADKVRVDLLEVMTELSRSLAGC